jgi:BMFP domain-containing protein YqiC
LPRRQTPTGLTNSTREDLQGGLRPRVDVIALLRSRLQALDVVDRDGFQGEKRVLTEALRELERLDRLFATDHGSSAGDSVKSTGG